MAIKFTVNQRVREVEAAPDTPLLYVLINDLELHGPRFGCGLAQCGSCSVLADGVEIRSCVTPIGKVAGKSITTFEGLPTLYAEQRKLATVPELHPLQQAVIDEQATAMRILLQRAGHESGGTALENAGAERTANSHRDERASLPVRDLSAVHEGHSACGAQDNFGINQRAARRWTMSNHDSGTGLQRRTFLKAGGALIIGAAVAPELLAQEGQAGGVPINAASGAAFSAFEPDPNQIDSWIAIHADNTATIFIGHHELGQGISTTLLQIAAEELDLDMAQVKSIPLETGKTPNQGGTYASSGIARGGPRIRLAAAEGRQALLKLASARLGTPIEKLTVTSGVVSVIGNPSLSP